jgi:hypothetical protein
MQTVLYFNPFLKLFMKRIEIERENCCDELVLQFEYDKHSYAAALLQLEKNAQSVPELAMAAAQKNNLLHRIEKIVGVHRKPSFNTTHFAGAFAVLMMLMVINSVLIAGKEKIVEAPFTHFSEPFSFFTNNKNIEESGKDKSTSTASFLAKTDRFLPATLQKQGPLMSIIEPLNLFVETPPEPSDPGFLHVSYNEAEVALNADQKKQVGKTVEDTRKVLEKNWKEIEKSIGDDLTAEEKMMAKKEYMKEVEKIDWKKLEKNLKSQYETINWDELNNSLNQTLVLAEIDSIKEVYTQVAVELQKMKVSENCAKAAAVAMPDASVRQVEKAKAEVKERLEEINKIKAKKVIVKL